MSGPDPNARASGGDRAAAIDQIEAAFKAGRIGSADRTIRKNNVASAATLGDLDLITRDLVGAAPAAQSAPTAPMAPPSEPAGAPVTDDSLWTPEPAAPRTELPAPPTEPAWAPPPQPTPERASPAGVAGRRKASWPLILTLFVIFDVGLVASLLVSGVVGSGVDFGGSSQEAQTGVAPTSNVVDGGDYDLSAGGIDHAIKMYADRFGTTRTLGATFYGEYAIFDVPVGDWTRHTSWILRDGSFSKMLDERVNTPLQQPLDLGRMDVPALVRNLARARRALGVDHPEMVYAIVAFDSFSEGPAVSIHVSNPDGSSGFLVTTLDGKLVRKYPFTQ